MENIIIDLKIKIQELENTNIALKTKMTLMYSNWQFDYSRFEQLKAKCKLTNNENNIIEDEDDEKTIRNIK